MVGSAKHQSLAEAERPEFYIPFAQDPDRYMDIVMRTGEPAPLAWRRCSGEPCTKSMRNSSSPRSGRFHNW